VRSGLRSSGSLSDALCAILRPANTEQTYIFKVKFKIKFTLFLATKIPRGSKVGSTLSLTSALDGLGGQPHAPAALSLGKRHCTHSWKLVGFKGRSREVPKTSTQKGFDSRTVQPAASRYSDSLPANIFVRLLTIFKKQISNFCMHFFSSIAKYLVKVA
jgi:hypothetical protein